MEWQKTNCSLTDVCLNFKDMAAKKVEPHPFSFVMSHSVEFGDTNLYMERQQTSTYTYV